jgi:hypothetical protein
LRSHRAAFTIFGEVRRKLVLFVIRRHHIMSGPNVILCAAGRKCRMSSPVIKETKHVCLGCQKPVHAICGINNGNANFRFSTTCRPCVEFGSSSSVSSLGTGTSARSDDRTEEESSSPQKRKKPPKKKCNEWLRDQFTRELQSLSKPSAMRSTLF